MAAAMQQQHTHGVGGGLRQGRVGNGAVATAALATLSSSSSSSMTTAAAAAAAPLGGSGSGGGGGGGAKLVLPPPVNNPSAPAPTNAAPTQVTVVRRLENAPLGMECVRDCDREAVEAVFLAMALLHSDRQDPPWEQSVSLVGETYHLKTFGFRSDVTAEDFERIKNAHDNCMRVAVNLAVQPEQSDQTGAVIAYVRTEKSAREAASSSSSSSAATQRNTHRDAAPSSMMPMTTDGGSGVSSMDDVYFTEAISLGGAHRVKRQRNEYLVSNDQGVTATVVSAGSCTPGADADGDNDGVLPPPSSSSSSTTGRDSPSAARMMASRRRLAATAAPAPSAPSATLSIASALRSLLPF